MGGRRPLLIAAVFGAFVAACFGHAANESMVGESDRPQLGRSARDAGVDGAAAPLAVNTLPANYRTAFTKLNQARMVSQGHATGRWDVDIYANDIAAKALAARAHDVPVGAIVVEEHYERSSGDARGPTMLMEKRPAGFSKEHGDWRWAFVGSQGQLVKDGFIEACAGCHDDAPMDGLFPILAP